MSSLSFSASTHGKKSAAATRSKVSDRFKAAMSQLSSLAGFPYHLGTRELCEKVAKPSALLPAALDDDIQARNVSKLKASLQSTKFCEIADCVKLTVGLKDKYKTALAELAKAGAVLPESDSKELDHLAEKIATSGKCIATCYLINLIVNKLTPVPVGKSRAAFVREYELCVKDLKFEPSELAKQWLENLLKDAAANDKKKTMPKPKMSPKKKVAMTVELY